MIEIIPERERTSDISRMAKIVIYAAVILMIIAIFAYCIIGFWIFDNASRLIEH